MNNPNATTLRVRWVQCTSAIDKDERTGQRQVKTLIAWDSELARELRGIPRSYSELARELLGSPRSDSELAREHLGIPRSYSELARELQGFPRSYSELARVTKFSRLNMD